MPAIDFDRIKDQGKNFADGFTPGQKAMTILGVIAVVIAGMTFSHWSSSTDYAPLYGNLSGADAAKVTDKLTSAGVKYKLTDGGATVMVPAGEVYKQRVALSADGLPSNNDGLALLDKEGITASEFVQRVDYQRAMQGELEKTINAIDGISATTVNLTIPPDQVFAGATADKPSAAVLVQPTGGTKIPSDTVQAIVHLVASSIPNLTPDTVTVADSSGNVLNAPGMDSSSSQGLEQQSAFDTTLSTSVSSFLAAALGPSHAQVHVQSELNFDQQKTTSITNTAPAGTNGKPLPQQQSNKSEKFTGGGGGTNGVLGVTQGVPGAANSGTQNYTKTDAQANNALDQVWKDVQQAPGKINRLSVAVLLDSTVVQPQAVADWTKQIQAAVGYNKARGDIVQVTTTTFSADSAKAAKAALKSGSAAAPNTMMDLVRHVVTLLIIALVLFFAWRAIKRAEANRVPLRVPLDLRELEAADTRALEASTVSASPRLSAAERQALAPAAPAELGMEGELTDLIEHQPDEVAQTLRSWLADRRT
jgi:flagellar M-ring protein FliF